MIYTASPLAVIIFFAVVATVLGISSYFARGLLSPAITSRQPPSLASAG